MFPSRGSGRLLALLTVAFVSVAHAVRAQDNGDNDQDDAARPTSEVVVTARRLDAARSNVDPALGATSYSLTTESIEGRPGNEAISLAQVLLQFPGVQADGSGQLRLRQSQGDLQYRINDVIIPEGASDLGESLSARIAQKVVVVTGALPAQYGFQTGGVVSVTTKSGAYLDGGQIEVYGGGQGQGEGAIEFGASTGSSNLFVSGSLQRNPVGLPSPDGSADPLHDRSDQADGFAYLDHVLSPRTRVSLILGLSDDRFQVPNVRGLSVPGFVSPEATYLEPLSVSGVTEATSEDLDDKQREANRFAVASLMHAEDRFTVQLAAFVRQSISTAQADGTADLLFKGAAYSNQQRGWAYGAQAEGVYELADAHTLRFGLQLASEQRSSTEVMAVLRTDASGRQTSDTPFALSEQTSAALGKYSAFLQDEWRATSDLTLNLGGRLDVVGGNGTETVFSPRASIVWQSPSGATFHAGYARYFVPAPLEDATPSPADIANTTASTPTVAFDALRPEWDDYLDVGLQTTWDHLTVGFDGFARRARDLIAEGQFGPANLPQSFNFSRARIAGVEVAATYVSGSFSGWANLALTRGVGRTISSNQAYFTAAQLAEIAARDVALPEDQRLTGSGGISYRRGRLLTTASLLLGSGLPRTLAGGQVNGAHLPAYAQSDFSVNYTLDGWRKRPLEARLDLINAFDSSYLLRDGTGLGDGMAAWGPRRGVFIGLEQTF